MKMNYLFPKVKPCNIPVVRNIVKVEKEDGPDSILDVGGILLRE